MTAGSTPATAVATTLARGWRPSSRASPASTRTVALAPSLMPELLPAVTDPSPRKAGRRRASASRVVSARGCSSRVTTMGSPLGWGTRTGTIWPSKRPPSAAATARRWLSRAKASCSSRVTPQRVATSSAVSPMDRGGCIAASAGLTNRQPRVVSTSGRSPRANAVSAFRVTSGARLIDSTPPATNASPSPTMMAWAALLMACRPEPHRRLTVRPPASTGSPASRPAMRATLRLSSPAWLAHPRMTSSTRSGGRPDRSTAARMTSAARSSGRTRDRAPPYRPTGVRTALTSHASRVARVRSRFMRRGPAWSRS